MPKLDPLNGSRLRRNRIKLLILRQWATGAGDGVSPYAVIFAEKLQRKDGLSIQPNYLCNFIEVLTGLFTRRTNWS
ncbi:hypothetical protein [Streptomyces sp. NRRL F-5126]|uniref:hypothetical protein n=1 Tax=Streptomyces sp. NRRL F-5126 TaxID=1463857 RepID=UPI00131C3B26|nr:hypothetical protein [Streptomyces sp. NRRL F-5126]